MNIWDYLDKSKFEYDKEDNSWIFENENQMVVYDLDADYPMFFGSKNRSINEPSKVYFHTGTYPLDEIFIDRDSIASQVAYKHYFIPNDLLKENK